MSKKRRSLRRRYTFILALMECLFALVYIFNSWLPRKSLFPRITKTVWHSLVLIFTKNSSCLQNCILKNSINILVSGRDFCWGMFLNFIAFSELINFNACWIFLSLEFQCLHIMLWHFSGFSYIERALSIKLSSVKPYNLILTN